MANCFPITSVPSDQLASPVNDTNACLCGVVSYNDVVCRAGRSEFRLVTGSETNVTIHEWDTRTGSYSVQLTDSAQDWSFQYEIYCIDNCGNELGPYGPATVSGNALTTLGSASVVTDGTITGTGTIADPLGWDCTAWGFTVEAGTTATVGDNSGGTGVLDLCGTDTIHLWSSNGTINAAVSDGSAIIDINAGYLADNGDSTYTYYDPTNTAAFTFTAGADIYLASGDYNAGTLSLTLTNGNVVPVDLSSLIETTTTLVDNGNGTFTYTSETGATTTVNVLDSVTAGTNITVTGTGTAADPHVVNSVLASVTAGTNVTVTGTGTAADPYIVNSTGGTTTTSSVTDRAAGGYTHSDGAAVPTTKDIFFQLNLAGTTLSLQDGDGTSINSVILPAGGTAFTCTDLNTCNVSDLSDVDTTGAIVGSVLKYDGTTWVVGTDVGGGTGDDWGAQVAQTDATLTGDGTAANPLSVANPFDCTDLNSCSVDSLSDVDTVTTAPTVGDALVWDGTNWVPVAAGAPNIVSFDLTNNLVGNGDVDGTTNQLDPDTAVTQSGVGSVTKFNNEFRINKTCTYEVKMTAFKGVGTSNSPAGATGWPGAGQYIGIVDNTNTLITSQEIPFIAGESIITMYVSATAGDVLFIKAGSNVGAGSSGNDTITYQTPSMVTWTELC